jgi:hypothetical protein
MPNTNNSAHTQSLLRYREHLLAPKLVEAAAQHPVSSLADKMYRQGNDRLPDATRGFVSPLGGQAVPAQQRRK